MIKAIITAIATAITWFFSERRAKAKDQKARERIAKEVAEGDEDKVNARISRAFKMGAAALLLTGLFGCFTKSETVYVRENDRVFALKPGSVYTNETTSVEWIVPRTVMQKLLFAGEGL